MRVLGFLGIVLFGCMREAPARPQVVTFQSGELRLYAKLYKPSGPGPFPAILWNHGSYGDPSPAFDALAPAFTSRGWVFFAPYRRGHGLSSAAGPYINDEIAAARKAGGMDAAVATTVRLLTTDHLNDQLAALAWLRAQPFVAKNRIAVGGNSFGGIETVLAVEREPWCAAIDASGAAMSWAGAPPLREVMLRAVRNARAPIFFLQAENDFDLAPTQTLSAAMKEAGKPAEAKIYPPFGKTEGDGHTFAFLGIAVWGHEAFPFLERHCGR